VNSRADVANVAEYAATRLIAGTLAGLPSGASSSLGRALGGLARTAGLRRAVAEAQLAASFPDRDADWVTGTIRACYRHFGREVSEIAMLFRFGTGALSARLVLDSSAEQHVASMKAGRAAILVGGHLGNWEVAGAYLSSLGVPIAAIVKRQSNARFDAWIQEARRQAGVEPIYMEDASRLVPGLLKSGTSVAIVADQAAGAGGETVTFLGRPASTFRGPARLALATGAPLVFGSLVRADKEYRMAFDACEEPERPADGAADRARILTESWVRRLEARVRETPAQYLWFHRRWKGRGTNQEMST
jgi:KDO2-lipid IV(A) lauroyltransferase